MPARLTSYPDPIFSRAGVDRPLWRSSCLSGLAIGLLAISSTAIGNDCADELRALPLPADAAAVYRDSQVAVGGRSMCQIAYTTEESINTLVSRYERHWEDKAGELFRLGNRDHGDAILTQSGGLWERYAEIRRDGPGYAVMVNIMATTSAEIPTGNPYLPLPDGFELYFQQSNRDGFSLIAHTSLAPKPATDRIIERLERARWHIDAYDSGELLGYRFAAMSRGTETLDLAVTEDGDKTKVAIHGLVPVSTDG